MISNSKSVNKFYGVYPKLILAGVASLLVALSAVGDVSQSKLQAMRALSEHMGVAVTSLSTSQWEKMGANRSFGHRCEFFVELPWNEQVDRDRALRCLDSGAASVANEILFAALVEKRQKLVRKVDPATGRVSDNDLKNLKLIAYMEDIVISQRVREGKPANWHVTGQGFIDEDSHDNFAYQSGDIVLSLSTSSISTLITQITMPQSRYSHAFIIDQRGGVNYTLESLIETGVIGKAFDVENGYSSHHYNNIVVLRINQPGIKDKVLDCARRHVDANTPYDEEMDISSPDKIFCSELVVSCLQEATGKEIGELVPQTSEISTEGNIFEFGRFLGLNNTKMNSPGDLLSSPYLDIVAQYRRSQNMVYAYQMYISGNLFIKRLREGFVVNNSIAPRIAGFLDRIIGFTPESVSSEALPYLVTLEKKLFQPALDGSDKLLGIEYRNPDEIKAKDRHMLALNIVDVYASMIETGSQSEVIQGTLTKDTDEDFRSWFRNFIGRTSLGSFFKNHEI